MEARLLFLLIVPFGLGRRALPWNSVEERLKPLEGYCYEYENGWWHYEWCHRGSVWQSRGEERIEIGTYSAPASQAETKRRQSLAHVHTDGERCSEKNMLNLPDNEVNATTPIGRRRLHLKRRSMTITYICCRPEHPGDGDSVHRRRSRSNLWIENITEPKPCEYEAVVCTRSAACTYEREEAGGQRKRLSRISEEARLEYREAARRIFFQGYEAYMNAAFPLGELRPLSCTGDHFDLVELPALTLIDSLDTLILMGNISAFFHGIQAVHAALPNRFHIDTNVSVFESTIRLLGGLLSAHLLALDYKAYGQANNIIYKNELLDLALDLGNRLLPAFNTSTGIPFGTVNLMHGVPRGETPIASLAGGGSLSLEFSILSALTGETVFGAKGVAAATALYQRRHPTSGLLGKHINTQSGKWIEAVSGIGSNSDSFYEYLLKMYALFGESEYWSMFRLVYESAMSAGIMRGDWYTDVDMSSGKQRKQHFENLQAFWPGLEVSADYISHAQRSLNAFHLVFHDLGGLPEDFDFVHMKLYIHNKNSHRAPLRPELAESTYLMYRATREPSWLWAGANMLEAMEELNAVNCGYAASKNVLAHELDDEMPSFFLTETAKYLYLLFDDHNPIHSKEIIFSTEAHPFDAVQIRALARQHNIMKTIHRPRTKKNIQDTILLENLAGLNMNQAEARRQKAWWQQMWRFLKRKPDTQHEDQILSSSANNQQQYVSSASKEIESSIPPFCRRPEWWQAVAYDPDFVDCTDTLRQSPRCPPSGTPPPRMQLGTPAEVPQIADNRILGPNGVEYKIQVFADGVHVASDDETIELSRVDTSITLVSSVLSENDVQMVAVGADGQEIECKLQLFSGHESVLDLECTTAGFGPTGALGARGAEEATASEVQIEAALYTPRLAAYREVCSASSLELAKDSIIIAQRGSCLFQEKAKFAADAGAAALVVVNSEPGPARFVMASSSTTDIDESEYEHIPAVMISHRDGLALQRLLLERRVLGHTQTASGQNDGDSTDNSDIQAKLMIQKRPLGPDSPLQVRTKDGMLRVMGRTGWGVVMTSNVEAASNEWKLFIVTEDDDDDVNDNADKDEQLRKKRIEDALEAIVSGQEINEPIYLEKPTANTDEFADYFQKKLQQRISLLNQQRCLPSLTPTRTAHAEHAESSISLISPDRSASALTCAYYALRCMCSIELL